ncbi:MAG: tyrosine-type recombinase/integrase [Gemmataceae bacterium]
MTRKRRGRNEGGVYQRADGLWVGSLSLGYDGKGKRTRRIVYGESKKQVQNKLDELRQKIRGGQPLDAEKLIVATFLQRWLDNTKRPAVGDTTYDRYEQHFRLSLIPYIGQVPLTKLTKFNVEQMYAEMEKAGVSRAEQQKAGKVLRSALRHAVSSDLITKNPAQFVPLPRREVSKKEVHPLEGTEPDRLLAALAGDRLYALYVLALDSGMRQGELFGLLWPDIDFERGEILVQRSLKQRKGKMELKETKTKHGRRRIRLTRITVDVLLEHRKRMLAEGRDVKTGPVFCNTTGTWLCRSNFTLRSFNPALKRAGLLEERTQAGKPKPRFHELRHTCATLLLLEDVNAKVVSERLGHARIEITINIYSHVLPTLQERAAEKLEGVMNRMVPRTVAS